ncbi:MAG: hypothetical protein ACI89U_003392 [Gammaproteobacteria bacterium]|jgi:hypothetical protein
MSGHYQVDHGISVSRIQETKVIVLVELCDAVMDTFYK